MAKAKTPPKNAVKATKNAPKPVEAKKMPVQKTAGKKVVLPKAATKPKPPVISQKGKQIAATPKKSAPIKTMPPKPTPKAPTLKSEKKSQGKEASPAKPVTETRPNAPMVLPPAPKPIPKGKIISREFLFELGQAIRTAILTYVHEARGREIVGTAVTGDATFELDRVAERALMAFLKNARAPIAYYSEDSGYTTFTNTQPQNLLIIDPIDGTRAAKSGFEACVISVATTRIIERPTMADIDNGCVMEIIGDRALYAERGKGTRIYQGEHVKRPKLSKNTTLETLAWSMTVPARPAELIFPVAARLMDLSSLKGGFFACNSSSFSLTRLVTNQLDACVDFANRFYRDVPNLVKDQFINAGRGAVISTAPYDMAAALLIAQEAGCVVTDAYGKSFDDVLLLDTTAQNQRSIIAAANPELHDKLLKFFDTRIIQYELLLQRRAEHAISNP